MPSGSSALSLIVSTPSAGSSGTGHSAPPRSSTRFRTAYGEDSSANELVRFLQYYNVLTKKNGRWVVNQARLRRVRMACEQGEDLAIDFVLEVAPASGGNSAKALVRATLTPKHSDP